MQRVQVCLPYNRTISTSTRTNITRDITILPSAMNADTKAVLLLQLQHELLHNDRADAVAEIAAGAY